MKNSFAGFAVSVLVATGLCCPLGLRAYEERNYITEAYLEAAEKAGTSSLVTAGGDWFPYPDYDDRDGWARIFGNDTGRIIAQGEKLLDYRWQIIPASAYLEYERSGDRKIMETPIDENRTALNRLLLAELAEGKGRFTDQLVDGLWMSCQMTSWVLSAHNPRQSSHRSLPDPREYIIDLVSGNYGATVSIAYHFLKDEIDRIDPSISYCIETAVKERILDPFLNPGVRNCNWWMAEGWKPGEIINNWNPWCNSNVLLCFLLMEKDQERLDQAMKLSMESTDRFLNFVKGDGACEEGPSYWGHAAGKLFDYLEILYEATGGRVSIFGNSQIRRMGEYISRSYIGDSKVVNFADATAVMKPDIYLVYRYGKAVGSEEMMDFATCLLYSPEKGRFSSPAVPLGNDTYRSIETAGILHDLQDRVDEANRELAVSTAPDVLRSLRAGVPSSSWYDETEFCYIRDASGNFFAAKGGFNNESHNHNDVGTFILYAGDTPLFVDAGVGTYTRKTFSSERYTIWSMQSNWHSLPIINGVPQSFGQEYRSSDVSCRLEEKRFSLDISRAYPDSASCRSWTRRYAVRDGLLEIRDSYRLLSRKAADVENFLVCGEVFLPGCKYQYGGEEHVVPRGRIVVVNGPAAAELSYPASLGPSVTEMRLEDPRLSGVWGDRLVRISLTSASDAPLSGTYAFSIRVCSDTAP